MPRDCLTLKATGPEGTMKHVDLTESISYLNNLSSRQRPCLDCFAPGAVESSNGCPEGFLYRFLERCPLNLPVK